MGQEFKKYGEKYDFRFRALLSMTTMTVAVDTISLSYYCTRNLYSKWGLPDTEMHFIKRWMIVNFAHKGRGVVVVTTPRTY